jgi:mono/diheme cytochrome c family protein
MVNRSTQLRGIVLAGVFTLASGVYGADDKAARGKYLVEEVAQCQNCHSPRMENGEYDKTKWLKGATLNLQPIQPIDKWHKTAPDLTPSGRLWGRWKEEGLVKFMETGRGPSGNAADPPMPTYKLSKDDAEAVVEYLKTLK